MSKDNPPKDAGQEAGEDSPTRRDLLAAVGGAAGLLVACGGKQDICAVANCVSPDMGVDMAPACSIDSFTILDADRMSIGQTVLLTNEETALHRDANGFAAMSLHCTHSGCLVSFDQADGTFNCPCHGSRFKSDGQVLRGPAAEPLLHRAMCRRGSTLVVSRTHYARDRVRVK